MRIAAGNNALPDLEILDHMGRPVPGSDSLLTCFGLPRLLAAVVASALALMGLRPRGFSR
jgi:hypothetical protein